MSDTRRRNWRTKYKGKRYRDGEPQSVPGIIRADRGEYRRDIADSDFGAIDHPAVRRQLKKTASRTRRLDGLKVIGDQIDEADGEGGR